MTSEEWQQVDHAVASALDIPAADREGLIASLLPGRADLIAEAHSLLAFDKDGEPDPVLTLDEPHRINRTIGSYRITAKAGEGGMGVVWSAERSDGQFERRVAIKFLAGLFRSTAVQERFLAERDILARLAHPNIAQLIDAGVVEHGEPYLVMEWVEGKRIDEHVQTKGLSTEEVLRLFLQVCGAVEYAHRQLVVHRDLKPSNIFVTSAGQVKLLDFGIAKLLDPARPAGNTATLQQVLTLDYASPEQVRGEPVTTSTDVYSLGIVLFELLAGKRPFDRSGKTLGEIVERAALVEPPKASSIRSTVSRELDAILGKAMAPRAVERYGSVVELSADLSRLLDGRPVLARPASPLYVLGKFARRNWIAASAAALALVLITGSAIIANRQRNKAQQRLVQLQELSNSVIFEFEDGIQRLPGSLELRRRMVKRSLEFLDSLSQDSQDDPRLLSDLARGYQRLAIVQGRPSQANLGDFAGALQSARKARRALDLLLRLRPDDFDDACDLGDLIFLTGQIQERVPQEDFKATLRQGVQYWEGLARKYPERERALSGFAGALFYKPDYQAALAIYEQLAERYPTKVKYSRDIALMCRYIANGKINVDERQRIIGRAIEIDRGRVRAQPLDRGARLDLSFDLSELGNIHQERKDLPQAIRVFEEVDTIREELVRLEPRDEQAKDRLLFVLCRLGQLHGLRKETAASVRYYRRAVALGEELSREARPNAQFEELFKSAKDGLARAKTG